uniref:Uncharacterized protein n=1 Tax=Arundo donax TaxID=35708 RepID=A0A0A9BKB3_ARUDO
MPTPPDGSPPPPVAAVPRLATRPAAITSAVPTAS